MTERVLTESGLKEVVKWVKGLTNRSTLYWGNDTAKTAASQQTTAFASTIYVGFNADTAISTTTNTRFFSVANVPYKTGVAESKTGVVTIAKKSSSDSAVTITAGTATNAAKVVFKPGTSGITVNGINVLASYSCSNYYFYVGASAPTSLALSDLSQATVSGSKVTCNWGSGKKGSRLYIIAPSDNNGYKDSQGVGWVKQGKGSRKTRKGASLTTTDVACYLQEVMTISDTTSGTFTVA